MPFMHHSQEREGSTQLHHQLTNIFPGEEADELACRLLDSFHYRFLVLQFASLSQPLILFQAGLTRLIALCSSDAFIDQFFITLQSIHESSPGEQTGE
jgi:hypothetical protein